MADTEHEFGVMEFEFRFAMFNDILNDGLIASADGGCEFFNDGYGDSELTLRVGLIDIPIDDCINDLIDFRNGFFTSATRSWVSLWWLGVMFCQLPLGWFAPC